MLKCRHRKRRARTGAIRKPLPRHVGDDAVMRDLIMVTGFASQQGSGIMLLNRESAWELLTEYTKSDSLRKHALAVEILMSAYAKKLGEDAEVWGIVGLLHDFDYEMYPTMPDHPTKGAEILRSHGYPEEIIYAISSHVSELKLPRHNLLCKAIYACDELAGFLVASALVRPGKSIQGMEARSVRKKLKDKAFARAVNREDIYHGAGELGVDLDEHITFCIRAMEENAALLGLAGQERPPETNQA
jgi:putative nucleotidyltransferase with HDIG domain